MASKDNINIAQDNMIGLQNQEKIEELYYKAIEDARLNDLQEAPQYDLGLPGSFQESFNRWSRKLDIFTLDKGGADFSTKQHEHIVKEFGAYRQKVITTLAKDFKYEDVPLSGHLSDIGSCIDGSKVGSVNEMDSLYVMQGNNLTIKKSHKHGLYHVYLEKHPTRLEIRPRKLREQLAKKYSDLISLEKLPECLEHGGYQSGYIHYPHCSERDDSLEDSGYSGVRYNGPAVTSQFLINDNTLLTWNVTPVVVLSDVKDIQTRVRNSAILQAIIVDNKDKMFLSDIHLFPDATTNLWRLTTAQMEAHALSLMSKHAPFKVAFSSCKVLSTALKEWHINITRLAPPDVDIVGALIQYNAMKDSATKTEAAEILNKMMRFAHIWIPRDRKDEYNEDKKSDISINNAAVKHILLKAASRNQGAFGPDKNPDLVKELIRSTFEELARGDSYNTEHAFLPELMISHFSVAPGMASQKWILARNIRQQCRTLVHEAMTEVRITHKARPFCRVTPKPKAKRIVEVNTR